jgi:2-polyprenyl-3-methyl-5-hydroxy-6-metoxy-1,4-benzoquinol methylase
MNDDKNHSYEGKPSGYFSTPRREMLEFIPPGTRAILEIGCGNGRFGALVKARDGCRYVGVELMEDAAQEARQRLDEVLTTNIESDELPFHQHSFDGLVCNDVLEHLVDPWRTLQRLTTLVRPGGFIVVSLPNVRFSEVVKDLVFRNRWEYQERGVLDRTHLRFFTEESVRGLLEQAGGRVERIEGINPIRYAWRLQLLNLALLGSLSSMRFPQIAARAVVASR